MTRKSLLLVRTTSECALKSAGAPRRIPVIDIQNSVRRVYCRVETKKTRDIAAPIARPDHRKSKFGLRHAIKLINAPDLDPGRVNCQTRAAAPRARDA